MKTRPAEYQMVSFYILENDCEFFCYDADEDIVCEVNGNYGGQCAPYACPLIGEWIGGEKEICIIDKKVFFEN